jgi:endonuclease/exonuclease/phosphatase family metal-dependent hydrolase
VPCCIVLAAALLIAFAGAFAAPATPSEPARPAARAAGTAPHAPPSLRVATWNIAWLSSREGAGEIRRAPADFERLRRYAERLDADIVALQEIDGVQAARRVFDPERYDFHFAAPSGRSGQAQRAGFAWRRSLRVTVNSDVDSLALAGRLRRGADVTVHLAPGDLRLLSVHLKADCVSKPLTSSDAACRELRDQEVALESWVDARAREGRPFAVLGDFNRRFTAHDPFWTALDDGDPPDATLTDAGEGRRPLCWGGRYRTFIDHIVLSRRAAAWLVPDSFTQQLYEAQDELYESTLSDHCALRATLDPGR